MIAIPPACAEVVRDSLNFRLTFRFPTRDMSAPDKPKTQTPPEPPAAEAPKRSAVKLPAGVVPKGPRGPQGRKPWETGGGGKPQRDAARRAGKSRKVH